MTAGCSFGSSDWRFLRRKREDSMVCCYLRIRSPLEEAMTRYGRWIGKPELGAPRLVPERDNVDAALADGQWLGLAVFVYPSGPWTVFEEISGGLAVRPAASWLELAQGGDLVYAGYNDTVPYAELVAVEHGRLVRQFVQDEQDSSADVDVGRLPEEAKQPFADWMDVMGWVEEDFEELTRPEQGWLWIHRAD
jgi:hypothetical protein